MLQGGTLGWNDAAHARPAAFEVSGLRVALKSFVLDGKKPASLEVGARIGAGRTEPGRLSYRGTVGLNPPSAQGAVDLVNLPVHAFEPYFGDLLNIELLRADASFLLAWKALNLRGSDVALAPGAPARVDVRETVLSDFYARVILSEEGRLNLQDLVKAQPGAAVPATPAQAAAMKPEVMRKDSEHNDQTTTGSGQNESKSGATSPRQAAAGPQAPHRSSTSARSTW
ncbi:MAG: DUF748 domain-containing protein [Comamonadaceae bacterium]|nr:DUF748 domain-containing protein [Comamonadaceae bacterium]